MKLICSESVFPESFWRSRIAACGDGPAVLTVPHVRYHAFYPASSILEDSMLYCSCVSRYRLLEGHRGLLLRPDFLSLRLVAAGSEFVRCNRTAWRMEPGDLMIFHPFHDYEYATGDAGFCEKYSITVKGTALASILRNSSLKDAYYLKLDDISAFREQYFRLERCMKSRGLPRNPRIAGILMELLQSLAGRIIPGGMPEVLLNLRQYMEQHPEADLSLEALSSRFGLSPASIARLFRRHLHCSPHRYVMRTRMEKARVLLEMQGVSCKEAAAACGFSSSFNFSTRFKRCYGISPRGFLHRFSGKDENS